MEAMRKAGSLGFQGPSRVETSLISQEFGSITLPNSF